MGATKIEWTATTTPDGTVFPGFTFNAWTGCSKVSPACDHCYAEAWAKRSGIVQWGAHPRRRTSESYWLQPLKWNRVAEREGVRRKVFCCSLADVFDNQADPQWRIDLFRLIGITPHLDWLLLTKRPQNIAKMLPSDYVLAGQPPHNVWLGTTVENQEEANRRIPHLLAVPAKVHFLSCEPLLGSVSLTSIPCEPNDVVMSNALVRHMDHPFGNMVHPKSRVDWVIVGGESGPDARPSHPDWFRSLRDQCARAGVPYFHKQNGEWLPTDDWYADHPVSLPLRTYRDGNWTDGGNGILEGEWLARIGTKKAGALLDGIEHKAMPA